MPLLGGSTSHLLPLPAARPGRPVPPVVEGWHSGDSLYYPIQWVESKDESTWELIRGLGILVHPSPPVQAYLWTTSFIGRISLVYTQGRHDLSSSGVYRTKSWRLEGVRIWKLSRTYPGEKPPSLSVLTHGCSLITRKPTRHLLTMPYILVRIGAPYEGGWSIQFHLPRNMAPSLNPRYLYSDVNLNELFKLSYDFDNLKAALGQMLKAMQANTRLCNDMKKTVDAQNKEITK